MEWRGNKVNRAIPLLLILLLVVSIGFGVYQYSETQRLKQENANLKQQLDTAATQLQVARTEETRLGTKLNQTQAQVTELQMKISTLEQNITQLRNELKLRDYTTIGLTFLWNPTLNVNVTHIYTLIKYIDEEQWDPVHIYFFVYHAEPKEWMPTSYTCLGSGPSPWTQTAADSFRGTDIPVGLFQRNTGASAGCAYWEENVIALDTSSLASFLVSSRDVAWASLDAPAIVLTHELLHVIGRLTDQQIEQNYYPAAIAPEWYSRLQTNARKFQMPIPPDEPS